eukprot:NODE_2416_length_1183_cov_129.358902_g2212_i1.p1 GENE.NODE_2416_length_1183_cov_129.358902_g2212_i1~~NODE_2416_length_1183_cov_129.358902_g2212_i1.p1  ORF type:complete len:361 (-),score=66.62 NODE_2416_length_1183_cov_129.358902_g2212_i1:96-1178(-)
MDFLQWSGKTPQPQEEEEAPDDGYLDQLLQGGTAPVHTPLGTPTPHSLLHSKTDPYHTRPLLAALGIGVFSLSFSGDGQCLAASGQDGEVRAYGMKSGALAYRFSTNLFQSPATVVRYRPDQRDRRNVAVVATASGHLQHWHVPTQRCLTKTVEQDNVIYAADFNAEGTTLATAGSDLAVRVYDEHKHTLTHTYKTNDAWEGHSARICAVKWHPKDPNVLLTGGWDRTIRMWDVRQPNTVRQWFGPYLCGQGLDVMGNTVVTGSCRLTQHLQFWELGSGTETKSVDVPVAGCEVWACQFIDLDTISVVGSKGVALLINHTTDTILKALPGQSSYYACATHSKHHAFGAADGNIAVLQQTG